MAKTYPTTFVGGPCDGQQRQLTEGQLRTGGVSCGGQNYIIQGIAPDVYQATWAKQVAQMEHQAPLGGHGQFDQAWIGVMRTLALGWPEGTRRIRHAGQRLARTVR